MEPGSEGKLGGNAGLEPDSPGELRVCSTEIEAAGYHLHNR